MRISSIDIGSNAIRQLIAEIGPDGSLKILKKHREMIRLGADVFHGGLIQEHTEKRLVVAFRRMALLSRKLKVDRQIAYATSAFRDARNKKPILAAIYKESGIRIKVISGQKEAELIRIAVQKTIGLNNEKCLLIDIGGGSIELTQLEKNKIAFSKSFKWGMVRMLAEAESLKISARELLRQKIEQQQSKLPQGSFDIAIGTGGNMDAMARLKLKILKKGPNTFITRSELEKIEHVFSKTAIHERIARFNIKPDRADVLEPALFLTLSLMKKYEIKKLKIPGVGLKEGAILSLLS